MVPGCHISVLSSVIPVPHQVDCCELRSANDFQWEGREAALAGSSQHLSMGMLGKTFVFAVLTGNAGGGGTWRVVLVEEFLESGQCLGLEFDEVVEFFVFLCTAGIDEMVS